MNIDDYAYILITVYFVYLNIYAYNSMQLSMYYQFNVRTLIVE